MLLTANDLSAFTLKAGEPFFLEVQLQDSTGAVLDLSERAFVLSFYREDRTAEEVIDGEQLMDATGRFLRFARDGRFSESLYGKNLMVELAERYLNGRAVITQGRLTVERSAAGVASFDGIITKFVTRITIRDNAVLGGPVAFTQQQLLFRPAVSPPVTLAALSLSGSLTAGAASSGTIIGATSGSTIAETIVGLTIDSDDRTYAFDGTGGAGTFPGGLVETHPNATNSPRASSVTIAPAVPKPVLGALSLSGSLVSGTPSAGTIAGLTVGSELTSTLAGLTVVRDDASYAFTGAAAGGLTGDLIETLAGAIGSPRSTSLTVQAGTLTVTPAPAAKSDSFVGDGALHTRPGWSVPAGEEGRWGTTGGTLFFRQLYGPLSRATFGADLPDQDVVIEYNTSGDTESGGWDQNNSFYDLLFTDDLNFLRCRWNKGVPAVTLNAVVAGNEGGPITFSGHGTGGPDTGTILFRIAGGTLRVAVNGGWCTQIGGRFNFPFDRATLSQIGGSSGPTHGKVAIEARTWRYARADAVSQSPVTITLDVDDEFVGRDSVTATGGTWTGSGTYVGTPVQWAARILTRSESVVADWAAPKAITASGGVFSMDVFLPTGGAYIVETAWIGSDGLAHVARSRPVLSGYHVVYYGQSNSVYRAYTNDGAVRGDRYASFVNANANQDNKFPAGHWASTLTGFRPANCIGLARTAAPLLNIPVATTATGVAATPISYLSPGGGGWDIFLQQISTLKGIVECVVWDQGEGDADGAQATANYVAIFRDTLLPALRQRCGNPAMKVLLAPPGNFPDPPLGSQTQAALNSQREFIRQAQQTLVETVPGVEYASFKLGADHGDDPYHYTQTAYYETLCTRDGLSVAKALGAVTYDGRGPLVTAASRNGAVIELTIDRNGADALNGPVDRATFSRARVASPVNSFKGYEVSADNFATNLPISSIAIAGGKLVITLASAPAGPVKVRSFAGANHDDSSLFVGSYAGGLTIPIAPIIKYLTA